jgi:structural maintenance of chromosomes protein 6
MENINTTSKVLSQKRTALPDLKEKRDAAAGRLAEASKALEQKKKLDDLKKELAWAHVAAKESEMGDKMLEVASGEKRLAKIKDAENIAQVCIETRFS